MDLTKKTELIITRSVAGARKRRSAYLQWLSLLGLLFVGLHLPACATLGRPFEFHGKESLVIGQTTRADVQAKYGAPFRVGVENGHDKWTYGYYRYRLFGGSVTKDLDITFDQRGIVVNYSYASSDPQEVSRSAK